MSLKSLTVLLLLLTPALAAAYENEQAALLGQYQAYAAQSARNGSGMPLEVQSNASDGMMTGDVYGELDQPFAAIAALLADPARWCEFLPLSFNVKSCTQERRADRTQLTLYAGRKQYQTPDEAYRLPYRFEVATSTPGFLKVVLAADHGPLGTRDSRIELTAVPVQRRTFLRVRLSHRSGLMSRLGTQTYLATLGKDKVGFSIVGRDHDGDPVYVKGMQGMIERNAVRYYLAMQAAFASQSLPSKDRYAASLRLWFDLTEHYPEQLHEMDREDYLRIKAMEWTNQRKLQNTLAPSAS